VTLLTVYSAHTGALQWQYFSSLNCFFSINFDLPVLSKTYSTKLDSSLLRMEGEFLNKNNKRKEIAANRHVLLMNYLLLTYNIPILIDKLLETTRTFKFKFARASCQTSWHDCSPMGRCFVLKFSKAHTKCKDGTGLASHPGGNRNTPSLIMLQKLG